MSSRHLQIWTVTLALVGLAVVLATFRDYGITWDEPVQSRYGEGVLRYFTSGLQDRSADDFHHMRFYGPLFELASALAYSAAPAAKYEIRHLLIGLTALLAALGVLKIGTRMPGGWVPLFAPLALLALPRFYGHAFNNSKDIPFACAFVWAVYAIWHFATHDRERQRFRPALLCGLAMGVLLAVRPGGLPLLLLMFGVGLAWRVWALHELRRPALRAVLLRAGTAWAIAWLVMLVCWPWAHENPILNPLRAVVAALSFPDTFPVLFDGTVTRSNALPHYYLAKYLWITTPLPILALAIAGLGAAVWKLRRAPRTPTSAALLLVGVWLLAPLGLATIGRPNVYDGMRHLLFALPALALLAGLGASTLLDSAVSAARAAGRPAWLAWLVNAAAALALAAAVASSGLEQVRLHPYQASYFNAFVGGLAAAGDRYETDYWLSSYKEAMEWVNAQAAREDRKITVLVAADPYSVECAGRYLGAGVEMVRTTSQGMAGEIPEAFDYYLATTRYGLDENFPESRVAHRVERDGATFTVIRERARTQRSLSASPREASSSGFAEPSQPLL